MQKIFFKEATALVLANVELRELLSDGDTVNKPYRSYLYDVAYTKGTDISTFIDLTATNEALTVDTTRVVPFYVDDLDKIDRKGSESCINFLNCWKLLLNMLATTGHPQGAYAQRLKIA